MRDEHGTATDMPRYDDGTADELLAERYGIPNPHRNEFSAGDIGAGLLAGMGSVLAISIVGGFAAAAVSLFAAGAHGWIAVAAFAPFVAIPVLLVVGAPAAALAAWLLRPVPWEALHLVAFALLGVAGSLAFALLWGWNLRILDLSTPMMVALPYAVPTAVVARIFGRRAALRRFARETGFGADTRDQDE